jgi:hypothetical protein
VLTRRVAQRLLLGQPLGRERPSSLRAALALGRQVSRPLMDALVTQATWVFFLPLLLLLSRSSKLPCSCQPPLASLKRGAPPLDPSLATAAASSRESEFET